MTILVLDRTTPLNLNSVCLGVQPLQQSVPIARAGRKQDLQTTGGKKSAKWARNCTLDCAKHIHIPAGLGQLNLESRGCDKSLFAHPQRCMKRQWQEGELKHHPGAAPRLPKGEHQLSRGDGGQRTRCRLRTPEGQPPCPWPLPELSQHSHLFQSGV